jgi:hypothetical protein
VEEKEEARRAVRGATSARDLRGATAAPSIEVSPLSLGFRKQKK